MYCLLSHQIGLTALMLASRVGHVEVVQALLEGGADPNIAEEVSVGVHTSNAG